MGLAKRKAEISVEDYLAGEEISPIRHEYLHGEVYAMAGVSQNHSRINGNLFAKLSGHLAEGGCEVYSENIKVNPSFKVYYYPDLVVTCEGDFANKYVSAEPVILVEVISRSTERIDRLEKLPAYKSIPSVQEIIFVDQERISVEIHRLQVTGDWITEYFEDTDDEFELSSIGLTIKLADVYRRVTFLEDDSVSPHIKPVVS